MIAFLFRKMWKNKWIMLSLLIGNIFLIGIVSGTPIYTQGAMQRILIKNLEQIQHDQNIHPTIIQLGYVFNTVSEDASVSSYETIRNTVIPNIIDSFNIPTLRVVENLKMDFIRVTPTVAREERPRIRNICLNSFEGFEDHITITHGRLPSNELVDGNVIEIIVSQRMMFHLDLLMGELMTVINTMYEVEEEEEEEEEESPFVRIVQNIGVVDEVPEFPDYYVIIVGVFETNDNPDVFWAANPNVFSRDALVSSELLRNHFLENFNPNYNLAADWTILLDFYSMSTFDVHRYIEADRNITTRLSWVTADILSYRQNFIEALVEYIDRTERLTTTLLVLQVPIYVFLAFYIYIISRQILRLEENDISVLKSRGTSRKKIIFIYLIQSIFMSALSLLFGIPLGMLVCLFLGASNGFLELVSRTAIEININRYVFIYSGIAAFASILMMLIPVIGFSKVTILDHKRSKSRKDKKPVWQRFFIDFLFIAISSYGYYNFMTQREILALTVVDVQVADPLLFISSSLFTIGLGLLCLRVYPYLIKLISVVGNKIWSPAMYASLLKMVRFSGEEQFIMIFLVFTLSLGVFSAKTARTLNVNAEDMIRYRIGADIVFAERFTDNVPPAAMEDAALMPDRIIFTEPDFERFRVFEEVDYLTKVMRSTVSVRRERATINDVTMMAIETDSFGRTAWYRNDLLPVHINFYLNALAMREEGVLLSENFRTRHEYELGDRITYIDQFGNRANGEVIGFVEYWPTFSDRIRVRGQGGQYIFEDAYLIVTNIGHIHSRWGMFPYQVWMRTNTPTNRFFYDFLAEEDIELIFFEDAAAEVINSRNDPILQGTNGMLTAGFIFTFLACFTGFLIYWVLSIRSRVLQFGVFRAMGMTRRNLISLLIYEQLFITLSAIIIGVIIGEISSRLFVPLIQIAYSPSIQLVPLMIVTETRDYVNIFSVIGIMITICLVMLGVLVSKIKIAQALKLGED